MRSRRIRSPRVGQAPHGVAQDQLLQRGAERRTQRAGAQAADRAGRRPRGTTRRRRRRAPPRGPGPPAAPAPARPSPRRLGDPVLRPGRLARRRHEHGLLEDRAVERVGLVEQGEHVQAAVDAGGPPARARRQARSARRVAAPRDRRRRAARPGSGRPPPARRRVVGPQDAPAARQRHRLDHARPTDRLGGRYDRVVTARLDHRERRLRDGPGRGQAPPHDRLVARRRDRVGRVVRPGPGALRPARPPPRRARRQRPRRRSGSAPTRRRASPPPPRDGRSRRRPHRSASRAVAHVWRASDTTTHLDAQPAGRLDEVGGAVGSRRQEEGHSGHGG